MLKAEQAAIPSMREKNATSKKRGNALVLSWKEYVEREQARTVVAKECEGKIEEEKAKKDQKSKWWQVKKEINGIKDVNLAVHGIFCFHLEG